MFRWLILRQVIIWTVRMVFSVFWFSVLCFAIFWRHIPGEVNNLAFTWQGRAILGGIPQEFDVQLLRVFRGAAWVTVVAGWITLSWLTLTILRVVF